MRIVPLAILILAALVILPVSAEVGEYWHLATETPAWGAPCYNHYGHSILSFNDELWMIGGYCNISGVNTAMAEVWNSTDGTRWNLTNGTAGFGNRSGQCATTFDGKMWIMGGSSSGVTTTQVWNSSDGVWWNLANNSAVVLAGSAYPCSLVNYSNALWFFTGYSTINKQVWTSSDGIIWKNVSTGAPFATSNLIQYYATAFVYDGLLYYIQGGPGDTAPTTSAGVSSAAIWSTADGANWYFNGTHPFPQYGLSAAPYNHKIVFVGGYGYGTDIMQATYVTTDLKTYSVSNTTHQFCAGNSQYSCGLAKMGDNALLEHDGKLWIVSPVTRKSGVEGGTGPFALGEPYVYWTDETTLPEGTDPNVGMCHETTTIMQTLLASMETTTGAALVLLSLGLVAFAASAIILFIRGGRE